MVYILIMYVYSRFKAGGGNLSTKQGYFVIVQIYEYVANHHIHWYRGYGLTTIIIM